MSDNDSERAQADSLYVVLIFGPRGQSVRCHIPAGYVDTHGFTDIVDRYLRPAFEYAGRPKPPFYDAKGPDVTAGGEA